MKSADVGPRGVRFSFWEILPERETTKRALSLTRILKSMPAAKFSATIS
jgi:hypothetical protein